MIDCEGTVRKFRESGRAIKKWAEVRGFDFRHVYHVLHGRVTLGGKLRDALLKDGLLAEKDEDKKAA